MDPVTNFAIVEVSTGYDASATSIVLETGEGAKLPAPASDGEFNLVWWNSTDYTNPADDPNVEIVRVTARSTDTLTVTRAQEGTSGSTKNTADKTYKMVLTITKKMIDDIESEIAAAGGGGRMPFLILSRRTTNTLKMIQGQGGFVKDGKRIFGVGSSAFYYRDRPSVEFPFPATATFVSGLTISPTVTTPVKDGSTDYLISFANGGTAGYRYDDAGANETSLTISGTTLTGARRIGYDGTHVYIQDGANDAATAIKRFTFSGSTLTYVDTITLGTAPSDTASECKQIIISANRIYFFDQDAPASGISFVAYDKSGTQQVAQAFAGEDSMGLIRDWSDPSKAFLLQASASSANGIIMASPVDIEAT